MAGNILELLVELGLILAVDVCVCLYTLKMRKRR